MGVKLQIEELIEMWVSERNGRLNINDFKEFCEWYGYDVNNLAQYFIKVVEEDE